MKKILPIIYLTFFCFQLFSQHASLDNCNRFDVSCWTETFMNLSVTSVMERHDTATQLGIAEIIKLNNFLDVHSKYKSKTDSISKAPLDIRIVFTYFDDSGKNHNIGFDCFGNYQLDGNTYYYDNRLAFVENELKVGFLPHKQLVDPTK